MVGKAPTKTCNSFGSPCWKRIRQSVVLPAPQHLGFHTSRCLNSALFNLGGLSTSRESQYLAKEYKRPRTEFSPYLELIRSSEVDTQKAPSSNLPATSTTDKRKIAEAGSSIAVSQDGSVTMSQTSYQDLQHSIKIMQEQLDEYKTRSRQLLEMYHKSSDDGVALRILCAIFALAILFTPQIQTFHVKALQALGFASERNEENFNKEEILRQPGLQLPELIWRAGVGSGSAKIDAEDAGDAGVAHPNRSWTLSSLFWAANH